MTHTVLKSAFALWVAGVVIGVIPVWGAFTGQNPSTPPSMAAANMVFDVRNGDQQGKLLLGDTELAFESLTDARHSQRWKYADIRELSRKKKDLRVRPHRGDTYDFQFKKKQDRDKIYDLISARILANRQPTK